MKLSRVLRLALLVSCLETVKGTSVDQKEKLFALVRIKFEVFLLFLFIIIIIQEIPRNDKKDGASAFHKKGLTLR